MEVRATVEQTDYTGKAQKKRSLDARPSIGKMAVIKNCEEEQEVENENEVEESTNTTSKVTLKVAPVNKQPPGRSEWL